MTRPALILHGGAGDIRRENISPELEVEMRSALRRAAAEAWNILVKGGAALDAVESAVRAMEDAPQFNAGRGSVVNAAGQFVMDASIMDGRHGAAGALASVLRLKNPISAARAVMESGKVVFMQGPAAEQFAAARGCELVDGSYFYTERRWNSWLKLRGAADVRLDHSSPGQTANAGDEGHGTVGAVALDSSGNLAAATSTGGMTNNLPGRIGDSAQNGAGTWAQNGVCAVSCTGTGESFIRANAAHDLAARLEYGNQELESAGQAVLNTVAAYGGEGGLIALAADGRPLLLCNSAGMYRAMPDAGGRILTAIFADEQLS